LTACGAPPQTALGVPAIGQPEARRHPFHRFELTVEIGEVAIAPVGDLGDGRSPPISWDEARPIRDWRVRPGASASRQWLRLPRLQADTLGEKLLGLRTGGKKVRPGEYGSHLAFGGKVADRVCMFEKYAKYLRRWELTPDGEPFKTYSSDLLPVDWVGHACMIKVAHTDEERRGGALMRWWDGIGAPIVIGYKGDAIWMFRAEDSRSLADMARNGQDDEASRIICEVAAKLHRPRKKLRLPDLVPLQQWFSDLQPAARSHGGILVRSAAAARDLLSSPQEVWVLHGDIHHGNVLDFGNLGWCAIDPKALIGERGFDFANIFCNPDFETATAPGRLARQASVVAEAARLDRARLMRWILAYAGLSAAWTLGEGGNPKLALTVAEIAAAEVG
jgi:streptomycin 6-kinase